MFLKHSICSSGDAQGDTEVKEMEKIPFPPSFPPERSLEQGFIRLEIQTSRCRLNARSAIPKLPGKDPAAGGQLGLHGGAAGRGRGARDSSEERSDSGGCHLHSWFLGPQEASAGPSAQDKVAGQGG